MLNVDRFFVAAHKALEAAPEEDRLREMTHAEQPLCSMTDEEADIAAAWLYDSIDRLRSMPNWESDEFEEG